MNIHWCLWESTCYGSGPMEPELLRGTESPARKAAASLDATAYVWKRQEPLCSGPVQAAFGGGQVEKQRCCCCWGQPPSSASPPSRAAAQPTAILSSRHSSHSLWLSRGTHWLWEGWRALTRVPCPLDTTTATFQLAQKIANVGPWCKSFLLRKNQLEALLSCILQLPPPSPQIEN